MPDGYAIGVFISFFTASLVFVTRLVLIWFPRRSKLIENLDKIGMTWSIHKGITLPAGYVPSHDMAQYIVVSFLKLATYTALSWVGLLLAISDLYLTYARYRSSYDGMLSFKLLSEKLFDEPRDILLHTLRAFGNEIRNKPNEEAYILDKFHTHKESLKTELNKVIDFTAEKGNPLLDFPDEKMLANLKEVMPNNPVWASTVDSFGKLKPFSVWENHFLSNLFEYDIEENCWKLSSVLVRIILYRAADLKYDMDVVEAPISDDETNCFEEVLGLDRDGDIREVYLKLLAKFGKSDGDSKCAIMLYCMMQLAPGYELPKSSVPSKDSVANE